MGILPWPAALLALSFGLGFPDIDLAIHYHRSIFTHSALFPLFAATYAGAAGGAFAFGVAVHLTADLFVQGWHGFALIKVPVIGSLGSLSPAWILANAFLCFLLAAWRWAGGPPWQRKACALVGAATMIGYSLLHEDKIVPILLMLVLGYAAWRLMRRPAQGRAP